MVIPGGIEYDSSYFSCKINSNHLGIDVSIYLDNVISNNNGKGTRVRGQNSGIVATIKNYVLPPNENVTEPTIFVKYNQSGTDGESVAFPDGEILILEESLTYGNTTLTAGETILTLSLENASATGSAFGINQGVYFIRGTFVDVSTSLIILDPYDPNPSFRVGLDIIEEVVMLMMMRHYMTTQKDLLILQHQVQIDLKYQLNYLRNLLQILMIQVL